MISARNLWRFYGDRPAVRGLELAVARGSAFGFIGPNGAGKTTTLRMIATLDRPLAGSIVVGGVDVLERPQEIRPHLGFMPDAFHAPDDLTCQEILDYAAQAYRVAPPRARRVRAVIDLCRLGAVLSQRANALSKGWQQRLLLARTLVHDPDLLLLDEPAAGLDPAARIEFREIVKELRGAGKTILVSSHILTELADFCDSVGIVEQGRTLVCGRIDDIRRRLERGLRVEVEVVSDPDAAREAIRRHPAVRTVDDALVLGDGVARLSAEMRAARDEEESAALRADLLAHLLAAGVRVAGLQARRATLDDVFLRVAVLGESVAIPDGADGLAAAPHGQASRRALLSQLRESAHP